MYNRHKSDMLRFLNVGIVIRQWVADELLEGGPDALVVSLGKFMYYVRGQLPYKMVGARDRAVQ